METVHLLMRQALPQRMVVQQVVLVAMLFMQQLEPKFIRLYVTEHQVTHQLSSTLKAP